MITSWLIIIFTLVILESLLSIDNAAVLATMVSVLPENQRGKALRWGIWGAFILRGACLLFASVLMELEWLKIVGGVYLGYLAIKHFAADEEEGDPTEHWLYKLCNKYLKMSLFWLTVIQVEFMDLAFSMDNVFAAVAMTDNILLIYAGVFIGILAMRFVAQKFVVIMEKYPALTGSAYIVIALLGIKLIVEGVVHYVPILQWIDPILENHWFKLAFSGCMMMIFFFPLLFRKKELDVVSDVNR